MEKAGWFLPHLSVQSCGVYVSGRRVAGAGASCLFVRDTEAARLVRAASPTRETAADAGIMYIKVTACLRGAPLIS